MAETTKATKAASNEASKKVFEVIHGSVAVAVLDGAAVVRKIGEEITDGELDAKTIEMLVREGMIRDTAAPLSPSEVSDQVVDHFLGLAQDLGLVTNDGATYAFGGKSFVGRSALRQAVTSVDLKAAIKGLVDTKNAAIAELTSRVAAGAPAKT